MNNLDLQQLRPQKNPEKTPVPMEIINGETLEIQAQLYSTQAELARAQKQLKDAYRVISWMSTSKFWKLRKYWLRLKKLFGFRDLSLCTASSGMADIEFDNSLNHLDREPNDPPSRLSTSDKLPEASNETIVGAIRDIDSIRYEVSRCFLNGHGIEIGAGTNPQPLPSGCKCDYFDIRTNEQILELFGKEVSYKVNSVEEIPNLFPEGADFLIAHNVIEHSSDPIGLLAKFQSYVRDQGTLVISLPHYQKCPDIERVVPSLEHLVLDHLLDRGDGAFESREHIYSFLLGWVDHLWMKDRNQYEYARFLLSEGRRNDHDLHWHSFDTPLSIKLVVATCKLVGCGAQLLSWADPETEISTSGDIILVYTIDKSESTVRDFPIVHTRELESIANKLDEAVQNLRRFSM
jgi:hypothetical protein